MITEYDLVSERKGVLLPGSARKSKTSNTLCSCQGTMWTRRAFIYHCGDNIMWDPPVLIPNTEVKPHRADGTVRDTVWESRTLPHFIERVRADSPDFFLCFQPPVVSFPRPPRGLLCPCRERTFEKSSANLACGQSDLPLARAETLRLICLTACLSERLRKARQNSISKSPDRRYRDFYFARNIVRCLA